MQTFCVDTVMDTYSQDDYVTWETIKGKRILPTTVIYRLQLIRHVPVTYIHLYTHTCLNIGISCVKNSIVPWHRL